jgi:pyridoxal 5'-phosphate synthase pdxT subunit
MVAPPRIGVLAVQGAFAAHERALRRLGAVPVPVRNPWELDGLAGVVLPGGESTTMSLLTQSNGLWDALARVVASGRPVLATCAGVILLSKEIMDGRPGQRSLALADIAVRRNGFGRQVFSFEADLALPDGGEPFTGVFIRSPVIERVGDDVEVLAYLHGPGAASPVLCRDRNMLLSTFHPELTDDLRIHALAFASHLADPVVAAAAAD